MTDEGLGQRLREADREELVDLVRREAWHLGIPEVRQVLQNPFCSEEVVRLLAAQRRLLGFYEARKALAVHRATPLPLAMRLLAGLYWRDLVALTTTMTVAPSVRRAAERRVVERLPSMAVGERASIARRATPRVLGALRNDPSPRVTEALLENPRLTEGTLLTMVTSEATSPQVLGVVGRSRSWSARYPVKVALCRNPKTPAQVALNLLPMLKKVDLRAVASDPRLAGALGRRARVLLGRHP